MSDNSRPRRAFSATCSQVRGDVVGGGGGHCGRGTLIGYEDELDGTLLRDVYPARGGESGAVDFRTENVRHPPRPDILGLYCPRRDRDGVGALRVASVHDAIGKLGDQVATTAHPILFRRGADAWPPPRPGVIPRCDVVIGMS